MDETMEEENLMKEGRVEENEVRLRETRGNREEGRQNQRHWQIETETKTNHSDCMTVHRGLLLVIGCGLRPGCNTHVCRLKACFVSHLGSLFDKQMFCVNLFFEYVFTLPRCIKD